jgi:hypothetical protein
MFLILFTLLTAAASVVTIGILSAFWEDIKNWLHRIAQKVVKTIKAAVIGTKIFIKKMMEAFEEVARTYQQDTQGKWYETTTTKTVSESEVPPEIKAKAKILNREVDITKELEKELKLVL